MTISWPQKPKSEPEPPAIPDVVVGPGGTRYVDCGTVAGIDTHITALMAKIAELAAHPKRVDVLWQDVDRLLEARLALDMEAWISPSDLPL